MPVLLQRAAVFSAEAINVNMLRRLTYRKKKGGGVNLAKVFNKPLIRLIILSDLYVLLIDFWQNDPNWMVVIFCIL